MIFYYIIATIILLAQLPVLLEAWRNLIYTRKKYRPKSSDYTPRIALISPCKGIDNTFDRNINALFQLDYPDYEIFFVVESSDDPAYQRLQQIIDRQKEVTPAVTAHITVAGIARQSSQKVHNLLAVCSELPSDFEVMAFVDSDACPKKHFLTSLVRPLRKSITGATTGYRWFVPTDNRLSSYVLSAANAFFASALGPHKWNSAWGGAMAIRRDTFDQLEIAKTWQNALSDDYALTCAVRKAQKEIIFVPSCFVASYEQTTWSELFSFARRQFIITRACMPRLWFTAVLAFGHFVLGFWIGLVVTLYLYLTGHPQTHLAAILPAALLAGAMFKATLRQVMIRKILPEDRKKLVIPALIDIFAHPLLSAYTFTAILSSATTRTITWRNVRYTIHSIDKTEILPPK